MYHCVHNNIWKSPQDTLCSFQNSSLSDNTMTKSGIISLVMYGVSGCARANCFHTHFECLSEVYCAVILVIHVWRQFRWMSEQLTASVVHTCAMCSACCYGNCCLHRWPADWIDMWWNRWFGWMRYFSVHELMVYWLPEYLQQQPQLQVTSGSLYL